MRAAGSRVDRETVVRTAADLADREGWAAVTLSAVAKAVDRHVTSLYAHVDSLAELRRAVVALALDELADDVWRAVLGKPPGEAMLAIAEEYRDFAKSRPGRAAAILEPWAPDPELDEKGARLAEPIRAILRSYGLDARQVTVAHHVFSATVEGFARAGRSKADLRQAVALLELGLTSGSWPATRAG